MDEADIAEEIAAMANNGTPDLIDIMPIVDVRRNGLNHGIRRELLKSFDQLCCGHVVLHLSWPIWQFTAIGVNQK